MPSTSGQQGPTSVTNSSNNITKAWTQAKQAYESVVHRLKRTEGELEAEREKSQDIRRAFEQKTKDTARMLDTLEEGLREREMMLREAKERCRRMEESVEKTRSEMNVTTCQLGWYIENVSKQEHIIYELRQENMNLRTLATTYEEELRTVREERAFNELCYHCHNSLGGMVLPSNMNKHLQHGPESMMSTLPANRYYPSLPAVPMGRPMTYNYRDSGLTEGIADQGIGQPIHQGHPVHPSTGMVEYDYLAGHPPGVTVHEVMNARHVDARMVMHNGHDRPPVYGNREEVGRTSL